MVKKLSKKSIEEEVDFDGSDLEVENDMEPIEEIPEVVDMEKLEEFTKKINQEFHKSFTAKGRQPDWTEALEVTGKKSIDPSLNVDDDIKRELMFYNISQQNAVIGINKLKEHKEKLNRPEDFFAEMLKSDHQMERVKKVIIKEQQGIKKFEQRKQKLQNVKFAKAVNCFFMF